MAQDGGHMKSMFFLVDLNLSGQHVDSTDVLGVCRFLFSKINTSNVATSPEGSQKTCD